MKLLVAYDESEVSGKVLELAEMHAKVFGAKVYVIISSVGGSEVPAETLLRAEQSLAQLRDRFAKEQIECDARLLVRGLQPGEDVVKFAEENGVDEIIIGIRKRSKVGKLLFGSNAQYIILSAPCPVVTVQ